MQFSKGSLENLFIGCHGSNVLILESSQNLVALKCAFSLVPLVWLKLHDAPLCF